MGVTPLGTHALPIEADRQHDGRRPQLCSADRQGVGVPRMVEAPRPHDLCPRWWHMLEDALQKVSDGQAHLLLRARGVCCPGLVVRIPQGDRLSSAGHETRVLERAAPHIPREIRGHPRSVRVTLLDVDVPPRLFRVA